MSTVTVSWRILAAAAIGLTVFVLDGLTAFKDALPVLYTACIVLVATPGAKWRVLVTGLLCAWASSFWFLREQWGKPLDGSAGRFAVSEVAIGITTLLCLLNKVAEGREREADARYRSIFNAAGFAIWESDWSVTLAVLKEAKALAGGTDLETWLVEHPEWLQRVRMASWTRELNDEARRLFDVDSDRTFRAGETTLAVHGGRPAVAQAYVRLFQGARVVEFEAELVKASGEKVELVMRITRLESGQPWTRVLAMAVDVTARREAQVRLDEALAELAHISRVMTLGQLAASIVHEVNQPLSAVIAYGRSGLRWLRREGPQARETAECLERMVASADRAAEVIARVRDLARKKAPAAEPVDLAVLIDETLGLLRREVQERGIRVRREVAPDIPAIVGDRVQFQQVLMNLILNAAEAMEQTPEAQRELTIAVSRQDGMVAVSVRDRGSGIAGLDENRMFEPFVTTKPQGLGIGLSICRSIVEGHGGRIWASNVEDGAEIVFSLPVQATGGGPAA